MISENARYWIWISKALGYNNIKVKRIFKLYNDIAEFVHGGEKEWKHCGIFTPNEMRKLKSTHVMANIQSKLLFVMVLVLLIMN